MQQWQAYCQSLSSVHRRSRMQTVQFPFTCGEDSVDSSDAVCNFKKLSQPENDPRKHSSMSRSFVNFLFLDSSLYAYSLPHSYKNTMALLVRNNFSKAASEIPKHVIKCKHIFVPFLSSIPACLVFCAAGVNTEEEVESSSQHCSFPSWEAVFCLPPVCLLISLW